MNTSTHDMFYTRLPVNQLMLAELLMEEHLFYKVPENWHVVITDVKNSTKAAADGLQQTVNLVATGSIVAVLNIAFNNNIQVPFFFGGDGATFIIPPTLLQDALTALQQHRENTMNGFGLDIRVGHVPVQEVYVQQHELRISKLKTSQLFNIPVLLGDGLMYAEKKIKGPDYVYENMAAPTAELNMSGMHCRWDKIKPPATNYEIVSLLVIARKGQQQATAFKKVIEALDAIYGAPDNRKPISVSKLKIKASFERVSKEMKTRLGGFNPIYFIRTWFTLVLGKFYFQTKKGKEYLYKLVDMTDTLVIDGKINTVITGTPEQRKQLDEALQQLENEGLLLYGLHVSSESVMSCYVRNLDDHHVHFVDGADGGYTKAATILKKKLALLLN
jgi:hypothetical protein